MNIIRRARDILKKDIGEKHKQFYVKSIKRNKGELEVHFINKDMFILGSEFFVVMKKDGTHEIFGGE